MAKSLLYSVPWHRKHFPRVGIIVPRDLSFIWCHLFLHCNGSSVREVVIVEDYGHFLISAKNRMEQKFPE